MAVLRTLHKRREFAKTMLASFWAVCLVIVPPLIFPRGAWAAPITQISYGPSGSVVGTFVSSSAADFVSFRPNPNDALGAGTTVTLTLPTGTTLNTAALAAGDFTVTQATTGTCSTAGSYTTPSAVSINSSTASLTVTVAAESLSKKGNKENCGLGQVTIKTSSSLSGTEIQHPTTATASATVTVTTSVGGSGSIASVSFIAGPPTSLIKTFGDSQSAPRTTTLSSSLVVTVADAFANPLAGTLVTFALASAPSGATGQSLTPSSAATNTSGQAATSVTLGSVAGPYTVTTSTVGLPSVTFAATASDGPTISSLTATPTSSGADISWATDENASSQADYGLTSTYGSATAENNTAPRVLQHNLALSNFLPCTKYHYRVRSKNTAGDERTSSNNAFTTAGCTGGAAVAAEVASRLSPSSGGSLSLSSGGIGLTLTVPPAFANAPAVFQVKQLDKASVLAAIGSPADQTAVGSHVYELSALPNEESALSSFASALAIRVSYSPSDVAGIDESTLRIYRWNGVSWQELSGCSVDTAAATVSCTTTAFSTFSLFGKARPPPQPSSPASASPTCGETPPGVTAPSLYAAIPEGQTAIRLFFTEGEEPLDTYVLTYGNAPNTYQWGALNIGGKGTRIYLVQSLSPTTTYFFRVRAGNGCATGPWSNELSATLLPVANPVSSPPALPADSPFPTSSQLPNQSTEELVAEATPKGLSREWGFVLLALLVGVSAGFPVVSLILLSRPFSRLGGLSQNKMLTNILYGSLGLLLAFAFAFAFAGLFGGF